MVYLNDYGYLERKTKGGKRNTHGKGTTRNWWIVHQHPNGYQGYINLGPATVCLPLNMVGKRIRLKAYLLNNKKEEK